MEENGRGNRKKYEIEEKKINKEEEETSHRDKKKQNILIRNKSNGKIQ